MPSSAHNSLDISIWRACPQRSRPTRRPGSRPEQFKARESGRVRPPAFAAPCRSLVRAAAGGRCTRQGAAAQPASPSACATCAPSRCRWNPDQPPPRFRACAALANRRLDLESGASRGRACACEPPGGGGAFCRARRACSLSLRRLLRARRRRHRRPHRWAGGPEAAVHLAGAGGRNGAAGTNRHRRVGGVLSRRPCVPVRWDQWAGGSGQRTGIGG